MPLTERCAFGGKASYSLYRSELLDRYSIHSYIFLWGDSDRLDLGLLLAGGMVACGITVGLLGVGYFLNIQMGENGKWVFGMHILLGNIIGSLLAAFLSPYGRGWSFLATGANVAMVGLLVFFFLTPHPRDLGFISSNGPEERSLEDTKNGAFCVFSVLYEGCIFHVHVLVTIYLSREGGPNALITTAVSADLVGHKWHGKNVKPRNKKTTIHNVEMKKESSNESPTFTAEEYKQIMALLKNGNNQPFANATGISTPNCDDIDAPSTLY
ncbi:hypothetical protein SADUNF_Sadunf01G0125700 [Salix dunnii]|uniref:Uncharacterized protein n=1 Tax=Salix dunnii TaxID=1413687 RepID=A0A835TK94_9ROSI|nr:hypothetical protein SADUNF_Sadunf01G0125700 [Salix dunnii]